MVKPLNAILRQFISSNQDWKQQLLANWNNIIGQKLSEKVCIEKITSDTIILGVINSSWLQELYMLSPVILKTINENLDRPRIKEVRFKQIGKKKPRDTKKKIDKNRPAKKVQLSTSEERALNNVTDKKLREALKAFCIRCHQER